MPTMRKPLKEEELTRIKQEVKSCVLSGASHVASLVACPVACDPVTESVFGCSGRVACQRHGVPHLLERISSWRKDGKEHDR